MLKKLLKNTKFKYSVKEFFNENKDELLDIILFGSSIRGKERPSDIDVLMLYKDKKNIDLSYEFRKKIEKIGYTLEITDKTYKELFEDSFTARESFLSEGYSLVYDKFLHEGLGYISFILFKYELKGFSKSNRMRFYYSLYGRNGQKGILNEINAIKFSDSVLLCPLQNSEMMKEYLNNWKINFVEFPIIIPGRLRSIL